MRIQSNVPAHRAPVRSEAQPPEDNHDDPHPTDWATLGNAALKGAEVGAISSVAGMLPGLSGQIAGPVAGALSAGVVFNNPEAAIPGLLIGFVSSVCQQRFGLLGLAAGPAFGALAATTAEMRRQIDM